MKRLAIVLVPFLASGLIFSSIACGSGSEQATSAPGAQPSSTITSEPTAIPAPVEITIGNYTDKTGPSANPGSLINMALDDMVRYYNENELIPGVRFKVISYDSQADPAKDIPGYEWLKEHGADVLYTYIPSAPITLKPKLERDRLVLFSLVPAREATEPPGYVFGIGSPLIEQYSYTFLKWLAKNDPDFPTDRPARIGGAGWAADYMEALLRGAKEYAQAHLEQYDWAGGHLTNFTFTWQTEVEALKGCDYVFPPAMMNHFVEESQSSGYTGKFIGTAYHTAFFNFIDKGNLWGKIDGMRIIMSNSWWNEKSKVVDLAKELLEKYHPGQLEEVMRTSNGYLTVGTIYIIFELIRKTVNEVGPDNFSSQALYNAANDFSLTIDGRETDSFNETKRLSRNWFAIYDFDAEKRDLVRLNPNEWLNVVQEP